MDIYYLIGAIGKPADDLLDAIPFEKVPDEDDAEETSVYFVAPEHGIQFATDVSGLVESIWLSSGHDDPGFRRFAGALLEGLDFDSTRKMVRESLGRPSADGTATSIVQPKIAISWDRYDRPSYSLHFEYVEGTGRLRRITLMEPSQVPR